MIFKNISGCCSLLCSDDSGYQWHHQFKCQFQCLAPDKWTTRTFPGAFKWIFLNHNIFFMKLCLPFHLQFLGSLTSCFVLPFLLHWGRIKTLSFCSLLFIVTNIFIIFSSTSSWTLRLSEFLAGFSSGLTSPALNIYSSEVFTEKRFDVAVVIVWKEYIFCCIIEDQSSRQWSVCWNCLENVSPPSSSTQSVPR